MLPVSFRSLCSPCIGHGHIPLKLICIIAMVTLMGLVWSSALGHTPLHTARRVIVAAGPAQRASRIRMQQAGSTHTWAG